MEESVKETRSTFGERLRWLSAAAAPSGWNVFDLFSCDTPKIHIYFHIILDFTVIILFVLAPEPASYQSVLPAPEEETEKSHCEAEVDGTHSHFSVPMSFHTQIAYIHFANVLRQIWHRR